MTFVSGINVWLMPFLVCAWLQWGIGI